MWIKLNLYSFILALVCLGLFLITSFTNIFDFVLSFGVHPVVIILGFTIFSFIIGLIGFIGVKDWKSAFRSITTTILSLGLTTVLVFMILIGQLMS
jgi:hypothetical protein